MSVLSQLFESVFEVEDLSFPMDLKPLPSRGIESWRLMKIKDPALIRELYQTWDLIHEIKIPHVSNVYLGVAFSFEPTKRLLNQICIVSLYLSQNLESIKLQKRFQKETELWFDSFTHCPDPIIIETENFKICNHSAEEKKSNDFIQWVSQKVDFGEVKVGTDLARIFGLKKELFQQEKYVEMALLASSIAHELNNPLSVMKSYTYFLCNDKKINKSQNQALNKLIDQVETVTSQLLRSVKGQEIVRNEWVSLPDVLKISIIQIQKRYQGVTITVSKSLKDDMWLHLDSKNLMELLIGSISLCLEESERENQSIEAMLSPKSGNREQYFEICFFTNIPWKEEYSLERNYDNLRKYWSFRSQLTWLHLDELCEKLDAGLLARNIDNKLILQLHIRRNQSEIEFGTDSEA